MSDGDYYDGCGDPDYYDLEFRQQNPDVYGYDEYMIDMYPPQTQRKRPATPNRSRYSRNDSEFSPEYLRWKAMHPDRVEYFQKHAGERQDHQQNEMSGGNLFLTLVVIGVPAFFILYFLLS
jgi:hypothetical protein